MDGKDLLLLLLHLIKNYCSPTEIKNGPSFGDLPPPFPIDLLTHINWY